MKIRVVKKDFSQYIEEFSTDEDGFYWSSTIDDGVWHEKHFTDMDNSHNMSFYNDVTPFYGELIWH